MWVSHLQLTNFRNYRSLELELPPGLVIVSSDNAQGKTNLLEALYLLAIAKSYRAPTERELVNWEATTPESPAQVSAVVQREGEPLRILVTIRPSAAPSGDTADRDAPPFTVQKHIRINGIPRLASELVGRVNAVLFTAQDIELVLGAPALRRRYLDILLCQLERDYLRALQRYQRTVTQRNHLLRQAREGRQHPEEEFHFWEEELARNGALVIEHRIRAVSALAGQATLIYEGLTTGIESLALTYTPSLALEGNHQRATLETTLLQALEEQRPREIAAGVCLLGPHRDDLDLRVNGVAAGMYSSRGQARTVALTLRLAEAEFLRQAQGEEPILLLDDVLSELDRHRRRQVLERSASYQQAIITTTDEDRIEPTFWARAACFTIVEGRVHPAPTSFPS